MKQYKSYETERLILKPTAIEDAPFMFELLNSPTWLQHIGDRNVKSVEDAVEYIRRRILPQLERLGYSNYTVIRKSDGVKLGVCGLYDREGLDGIDIGFAFLPAHVNKGYAFEAALEIKRAGLENFGITRMVAITTKDNRASQKLLQKLGFEFINTILLPGDVEELMLYEYLQQVK